MSDRCRTVRSDQGQPTFSLVAVIVSVVLAWLLVWREAD